MQKIFFEILVQTALTVGLFWTILKLTPKSALLSFTILYTILILDDHGNNLDLFTISLEPSSSSEVPYSTNQ